VSATRSCVAPWTPPVCRDRAQARSRYGAKKESELPRNGPPPRRELVPTRFTVGARDPSCATRSSLGESARWPSASCYDALEVVREKTSGDPLQLLKRALDTPDPSSRCAAAASAVANLPGPVELRRARATTLSIRWLVGYARQRRERTMALRLANEILDASNGVGATVKRKEDLHKMAESNKAFAHYRW